MTVGGPDVPLVRDAVLRGAEELDAEAAVVADGLGEGDVEEGDGVMTVCVTVVANVVTVLYSIAETVTIARFAEVLLLGETVTVVTVMLSYTVVVVTRPPRPGLVAGRVEVVVARPLMIVVVVTRPPFFPVLLVGLGAPGDWV